MKLIEGQWQKDLKQLLSLHLGFASEKTAPVGFPKDWNECLASWGYALSLHRLHQRERLARERQEQVALYNDLLAPFTKEGLILPPAGLLSHYPIRIADPYGLRARLLSRGVATRPPVVAQLLCDYPELTGDSLGQLSRARELCRRTLHLPLDFGMKVSEQKRVAKEVGRWIRERGTEIRFRDLATGSAAP